MQARRWGGRQFQGRVRRRVQRRVQRRKWPLARRGQPRQARSPSPRPLGRRRNFAPIVRPLSDPIGWRPTNARPLPPSPCQSLQPGPQEPPPCARPAATAPIAGAASSGPTQRVPLLRIAQAGQHRAREQQATGMRQHQRRERLHVDVADGVGLVLDVDPAIAMARVGLAQGIENGLVLAARAAPGGTQANDIEHHVGREDRLLQGHGNHCRARAPHPGHAWLPPWRSPRYPPPATAPPSLAKEAP